LGGEPSKAHARCGIKKGEFKELRLLNLVNPVNLTSLVFTGLHDLQDSQGSPSHRLENSQILAGPGANDSSET
jgi:hypothetical protein